MKKLLRNHWGYASGMKVGDIVYRYGSPQGLFIVTDIFLKPVQEGHIPTFHVQVWSKTRENFEEYEEYTLRHLDDLISSHKEKLAHHTKHRQEFVDNLPEGIIGLIVDNKDAHYATETS